jgi:hypothetical protein
VFNPPDPDLALARPVGQWRFDEGQGAQAWDSSGQGNHGTILGGVAWGTGQSGSALRFNGVDTCVQIGDRPSLRMSDALTISTWVNPSALAGPAGNLILSKAGEYELTRFPDGTLRLSFANNSRFRMCRVSDVSGSRQTRICVRARNGFRPAPSA